MFKQINFFTKNVLFTFISIQIQYLGLCFMKCCDCEPIVIWEFKNIKTELLVYSLKHVAASLTQQNV